MQSVGDGMDRIISVLYFISDSAFTILYIIMFYISLKKCFLREGQSKVKLFFLTLFTNPMVLFTVSLLASVVAEFLLFVLFTGKDLASVSNQFDEDAYTPLAGIVIGGCLFILLAILFSRLIGKWLKTPNKSLVSFVYLMYAVIFGLSGGSNAEDNVNSVIPTEGIDLLSKIAFIFAVWLLYHFVIKAVSELTDRKRQINGKLFLIPPAIFLPLYYAFDYLTYMIGGYAANLVARVYALIILLLFIWAFYVIIKNINATNAAIEAKDLAAEMARAEARIEADLSIAKSIQSSALPNVFPPFPERKKFELFACMNAAKEVGGDFYDFYLLDDNTLGFLIADVSGKSIPGAMFMMTSKTVIKSFAESGRSPAEVFTLANERLCEGNEAEMFVTAWLGYLDLKTGLVRIANAGHNPPILVRDGEAEYVIRRPGLMLAGMEGVRYKEHTLQLQRGDLLYLYTDGVTEAMNPDEEQYGEDRLQELLSFGDHYPEPTEGNGIAEYVCRRVLSDVAEFSNGAEQSDDITMLCIRYLGGE